MAKKKNIEDIEPNKPKLIPMFTKEQILKSKKVNHSKDILNIVLDDKKTYSLDAVDSLVNKFKERKVK